MKLFWASTGLKGHHDLAVIDAAGQLVAKKRITDDPAGFARAHRSSHRRWRQCRGPGAGGDRNPARSAVAALRATGVRCMRSTR